MPFILPLQVPTKLDFKKTIVSVTVAAVHPKTITLKKFVF